MGTVVVRPLFVTIPLTLSVYANCDKFCHRRICRRGHRCGLWSRQTMYTGVLVTLTFCLGDFIVFWVKTVWSSVCCVRFKESSIYLVVEFVLFSLLKRQLTRKGQRESLLFFEGHLYSFRGMTSFFRFYSPVGRSFGRNQNTLSLKVSSCLWND